MYLFLSHLGINHLESWKIRNEGMEGKSIYLVFSIIGDSTQRTRLGSVFSNIVRHKT